MSTGRYKSGAPKGVSPSRKIAKPAPVDSVVAQAEPPFVQAQTNPAALPVEAATGIAAAMAAAVPAPIDIPAEVAAPMVPAVEAVAETLSTQIEQGTKTMTDLNQNFETAKVTTDRFQAAFGDVNERAKAAVEKSTKMFEEATELTKGNVEALVASSKIAAKGVETLGQEAADYGRRSFEEASAVLKSFADVKSPTELFKLQSDFARSAFDAMVAESSKVSETMLKLAGDVVEPLTSRYTVAVERAKALAN